LEINHSKFFFEIELYIRKTICTSPFSVLPGFISLDCGLASNESPYNEANSNLTYISDADFIQGGKTGNVQKDLLMKLRKPYTVLRYFPDGIRNCYSLNVKQDTNYLIRVMFRYGNYDGLNNSPRFDLYLGPNIWTTIDMGKSGDGVLEEIIHITRSNILDICLVKTGTSTPMISSIELRPLLYDTYIAQTGSLRNYNRFYFTDSNNYIRYPQDVHDRIWVPLILPEWTHINTSHHVIDSIDGYDPPQDVLRTGAMPANASDPMTITWNLKTATDQVYGYIYIAEIMEVQANETREFEVVVNNKVHFDPFRPTRFEAQVMFNNVPLTCEGGFCRLQLIKTPKSTLPPLMNAFEIFTGIEFPQSETNQNDVIAVKNIQASYGLNRISWQGDPCVPKQFLWTGLSCNVIDVSTPPRIVKLDLSSSGLNGVIPPSIQNLTQLQELDLSQNNLTGKVPEFLAKMKYLLVINLSGNKLSGLVPQALLDRKKEGLKLLVDENMICVSCGTRFPTAAVAASVSAVAIIILVLVLIFVLRRRKPSAGKVTRSSFKSENRRFTYSDVNKMTNNFQVVIGKGGFGVVYQGCLNNEQAAIKVLSHSSAQGYKEFKTEVELLLRVHHEKLVSLIGYCDDDNGLALIYELMGKGNLKEHLSGKPGCSVLSWPIRLKIALESAIGIEYLHTGCKPKIVHRDVKSTNILLSEEFEAKIADFGLSRSFLIGNEAQPTVVAGTFGYLDPEYHKTSLLSMKSDVYSFGVVLLEIISGQDVIDLSRENCNIVEWTSFILENGDIESIVDPNLHQDYDTSSAWKVVELAMSCVNRTSKERPNMSQVVHVLNECLETCEKWRKSQEVDLSSPLELSIVVDTEINPKAR
jgi:hypothetical protein